ncbi:polysaccharide deacetylase family protein [Rhizobium sp. BK251]|uniref:polysaccharide deacetylase family protein n=1 Tax=Rhizobium sp. BK251 TaxID=2512125 RepID=UPI00105402BE|nr:polysaccharide deacetylase family protein [Rhizobium sp. BK251]TCL75918.1 polysaccharide deacetylase [Rhizobium sp. BK251]
MKDGIKPLLRSYGKQAAISGALEVSSLLGAAGLLPGARGRGAVFTLHHVRPHLPRPFEPNRHLEIAPEFLDLAIRQLKRDGYVFVALDELPALLDGPGNLPPFAAFTLDDGNRNNAEHALPVFERHQVPFTVFVCRGLSERTHGMWWETLAALLGALDRVTFDFGQGEETLELRTPTQKQSAFDAFAAYVHSTDEAEAVAAIGRLAQSHGVDPLGIVERLIMDGDELKRLVENPLASLGAHTLSHRALARLCEAEAAAEMVLSADYVATLTDRRPSTLAYPYGTPGAVSKREARLASELGFKVAVTTQPGTISPEPGMPLTHLPRLSLNGHFQKPRYVSALASGIPFRLKAR